MIAPARAHVLFARRTDKAVYLDGAARADAHLPEIAALGAHLQALPWPDRARYVFDFVRARVRWRQDPGGREQFADAATVLRDGADDCDGSARAVVALALASGLGACIRAVLDSEGYVEHFQALLWWPGSEDHPLADDDGRVLAETTLRGVLLGDGSEASPDAARL